MSKTDIYPLSDQILVERAEAQEKTAGGLFLPEKAKEKPREGKVVAVGRGRVTSKGRLIEPQLKTGDRVYFYGFAGTEVERGGKKFLLMRESDVLAVVE